MHFYLVNTYIYIETCFGRNVKPLVPAAFAVVSTTNPHWARLVDYVLCVIHKERLCPSSGDINRLMMITPLIKKGGN
jgi:hypothetical protein